MLQNGVGGSLFSSSTYIGVELTELTISCCSSSSIELTELTELTELRHNLLDEYRKKQSFRVAIGTSKWIHYEIGQFKPEYNLREILKDEIVIEFDTLKKWEVMDTQEKHEFLEICARAISQTGINLVNAGYDFEYWEHGGKSPHLHIHNLPIAQLTDSQRATFKKIFIKKYVPEEFHKYVDLTLTGIHVIALEWANHWKGCWGVKRLIAKCEGGIYK